MSQLTRQEKKIIASRIASELLETCEYANVYEEPCLEDEPEEVWQEIHRMITRDMLAIFEDEVEEWSPTAI